VKEICQLSYNARKYTLLNQNIQTLSKKHGQLKSAIQAMVELVLGWLPKIKERDGTERWLELIETLRSVTEGKVRVVMWSACSTSQALFRFS
jgi:26S proteasome regulatory subunit N5